MTRIINKGQCQRGFSLVEVVISLAIVVLSFLVTFGLISQSLRQSSHILGETTASGVANHIISDISASLKSDSTSASQTPPSKTFVYSIAIPTSLNATGSLASDSSAPYYFFDPTGLYISTGTVSPANAAYRATVGVNKIAASPPSNVFSVHVVVYWPAAGDPTAVPLTLNSFDIVTEESD